MITLFLTLPLLTWVIAQTSKFLFAIIRGDFNPRYLYASGGMPSVHSAVVCSLATVALVEGGIASPLFGITGVLAAIVMYDSFGVRRSSGEQAVTLNRLIDDLAGSGGLKNANKYNHLREIFGHKPLEVAVGAIFGILLTCLLEIDKLSRQINFLIAQPLSNEMKLYAVLVAIMVIASLIYYWWTVGHHRKDKVYRNLAKQVLMSGFVSGAILAILVLAQQQNVNYLNSRVLTWLVIAGWLAWLSVVVSGAAKKINQDQASRHQNVRRDHWLKKAGRKT